MEKINNIEVIKIGNQIWQTVNLNVDKFRNGDPIIEIVDDVNWEQRTENGNPYWCYYNNNFENGVNYGKLYNWWTVNDSRSLAPLGFHIPSNNEWQELIKYLGGMEHAGTKMKNISGWKNNGNGTNESIFTAKPNGRRYLEGGFDDFDNDKSYWWSSTESNQYMSWFWNLYFCDGEVLRNQAYKDAGMCVRCIAD